MVPAAVTRVSIRRWRMRHGRPRVRNRTLRTCLRRPYRRIIIGLRIVIRRGIAVVAGIVSRIISWPIVAVVRRAIAVAVTRIRVGVRIAVIIWIVPIGIVEAAPGISEAAESEEEAVAAKTAKASAESVAESKASEAAAIESDRKSG